MDLNQKADQLEYYSSEGEEIAIDRRWEVATFLQMLSRDSRISQHILAFQVPGRKGKTRLLRRFERICELSVARGELILYARVDFRDRPLSPHVLAYELATTMLDNAEGVGGELIHHLAPLERLRDKIREPGPDLELTDLARSLVNCLRTMAGEWTVVLMLDSFEQAGEGGDWLLRHCLPMFRGIDGVIVILSGRSGLSQLESWEEVVFRGALGLLLHWEDCQRLAELHYQLKISQEQAKRIVERNGGDLQQIDMTLKVMKDFPHLLAKWCDVGG